MLDTMKSTRGPFAHLLWVEAPHASSPLAALAYRLRTETARAQLARWARAGWTHLVAYRQRQRVGPVHYTGAEVPVALWPLTSPEALQLLVASLAAGEVYREATDVVGTGPGMVARLAGLREELDRIEAARAAVS